jgi:hypothetical protein
MRTDGAPFGPLALSIALLVSLGVPSDAAAQNASALVLKKTGTTVPDVQPYSEIPVGTTVLLQPGARLVFHHYQTCRTVTTVGGTVTFGGLTYTITGGSAPQEVKASCPRTGRVGGENAGTVMRFSGGQAGQDPFGAARAPDLSFISRLSLSPTFTLVGARADDFASIRVSQGGTTLLEAPLSGRGFRWPARTAPLVANTDYELILIPRAGDKTHVTVKFRAEGGSSPAAGDHLTLIRVD